MSGTKHTAGPWEVLEMAIERAEYPFEFKIIGPDGGIATVENYRFNGEEYAANRANAHLIAAAPDLLEACEAFPGFTNDATVGDAWLAKLRAAIAKAKGEA